MGLSSRRPNRPDSRAAKRPPRRVPAAGAALPTRDPAEVSAAELALRLYMQELRVKPYGHASTVLSAVHRLRKS